MGTRIEIIIQVYLSTLFAIAVPIIIVTKRDAWPLYFMLPPLWLVCIFVWCEAFNNWNAK